MSLPITQDRMRQWRQRLLEDKDDLQRRVARNDRYQLQESMRDSLDELSMYDNHPADLGSEVFERGKDYALMERDAIRLDRIEAALQRMETGEYGCCKECGAFISPERLDAMPTAEYCIEHEPRQDTSARRPIEERFLQPPFGRTGMDETGQTAFDGEDAWQIVASWGNSNSPALSEDNRMEDENEGFVEPIESFLATDITGRHVSVVRSREYRRYLDAGEGEHLLEPDGYYDEHQPHQ